MTLRLGAVGLRSTHLEHFSRELGAEARIVRALALPDEDDCPVPEGVERWDDPESFIAGLDGALILTRDARRHEADAAPALASGLPVFIDKPLAISSDAAKRLLASGRVTSFSVLRFLREIEALASTPRFPLRIEVPADQASPYGGRWFLGIHAAELAAALCGPALEFSSTRELRGNLHILLDGARGQVELVLRTGIRDYVVEAGGQRLLLDAAAAYAPGAAAIERFFVTGGHSPVPEAEMLAAVRLLETAFSARNDTAESR